MKIENNHTAAGTDQDSYARNSIIQAMSISKEFPTIKEALERLYATMQPKCIMVGELGCASGPNTLMVIPEVIDITYKTYRAMNFQDIPEISVFLNDLPANDFNTIALSLASFHKKLDVDRKGDVGRCYVSATPGSYLTRIFPDNFLHFVHCSQSAHWLSQVPKGLLTKGEGSINKGNIYIADTSPPEVHGAYREQFEEDFTTFLKQRGEEIVTGGCMVINLMASTKSYRPQDYFMKQALNIPFGDMASEGLIDRKKLDEFELAFYPPTTEELMKVIVDEGSFHVQKHGIFTVDWDLPIKDPRNYYGKISEAEKIDVNERAKYVAAPLIATTKYMMGTQFGEHVLDEYYARVTKVLADRLSSGRKCESLHHSISLIKI
ncbi:putative methyltransferase TCM_000336 [Silene latifolia]|uniref:putative methyltransferase TCM_000336 n=1 Tax=Silene latifolia TaxID=37657 RepID=UPI003D782B41